MDNAIIARISITELPKMNTLNMGNVMGFTVLVSKNVKDGDLGVLFNEGLALSEPFLEANKLVREKQADGKYKGYFEPTGRVKAVRFNGVKSEAFWIELESLKFTGYKLEKLKEGDNVEELNGIKISAKYYTKATRAARNGVSKKLLRGNTKWFVKHKDTEQFRYYAEQIPEGSTIIITKKLHGTSHRNAYNLDERKLRWYEKILGKFLSLKTLEYRNYVGTRNVIVSDKEGFHSNKLREIASSNFIGKLHKGEEVFCEIVGFDGQAPIMPKHSTLGLKDKTAQKLYGDVITYNYGCKEGECDVYVYRICMINEDGFLLEYPWEYVKARCGEMGVKHVKEACVPFRYDGNVENLRKLVEELTEGPSDYPNIPNEGICLRYENRMHTNIVKNKSFLFKVMEGIIRESEEYIDPEEIS